MALGDEVSGPGSGFPGGGERGAAAVQASAWKGLRAFWTHHVATGAGGGEGAGGFGGGGGGSGDRNAQEAAAALAAVAEMLRSLPPPPDILPGEEDLGLPGPQGGVPGGMPEAQNNGGAAFGESKDISEDISRLGTAAWVWAQALLCLEALPAEKVAPLALPSACRCVYKHLHVHISLLGHMPVTAGQGTMLCAHALAVNCPTGALLL